MTKEKFLYEMKRRVARMAATGSALRNTGAKGVVGLARTFLESLELSDFTKGDFPAVLDEKTERLCDVFREVLPPDKGECWGLARKALNLFLRDAFYNRFLYEKFGLESIAQELETPLDGDADSGLRRHHREKHGTALPKWPRLKGKREAYEAHRNAAKEFAKDHCGGFAPVHADLLLYNAKG
jgi:hypothetical protein